MSAFANTSGGILLLGVDEGGGFVPVESFALDRVLDQFVTGMGDGDPQGARLMRPPAYHLHGLTFEGHPILAVEIEALPMDCRPCLIVGRGIVGGSYKRVDDKDVKLSATEVYALDNYLKPGRADRGIVADAGMRDLRPSLLDSLLVGERGSKALRGASTREEGLSRLNVLSPEGNVRLAGLLVFGEYPQQFFPKLVVDVAVHPGLQKSDPASPVRFLDRAVCEGPIGEVIDDALLAIARNLRTRSLVRGLGRTDEPELPEEVIREALANSLVHREYAEAFVGQAVSVDVYPNRVEVTNSGGLWGGKTAENLADGTSACRNAALMRLMAAMSLGWGAGAPVEGNGGGVLLMRRAMVQRGLPEPVFEPGIDRFKVTLFREAAVGPQDGAAVSAAAATVEGSRPRWPRGEWNRRVVEALERGGSLAVGELAAVLGRPADSLRPHLRELVASGIIEATARPTARTEDTDFRSSR